MAVLTTSWCGSDGYLYVQETTAAGVYAQRVGAPETRHFYVCRCMTASKVFPTVPASPKGLSLGTQRAALSPRRRKESSAEMSGIGAELFPSWSDVVARREWEVGFAKERLARMEVVDLPLCRIERVGA